MRMERRVETYALRSIERIGLFENRPQPRSNLPFQGVSRRFRSLSVGERMMLCDTYDATVEFGLNPPFLLSPEIAEGDTTRP